MTFDDVLGCSGGFNLSQKVIFLGQTVTKYTNGDGLGYQNEKKSCLVVCDHNICLKTQKILNFSGKKHVFAYFSKKKHLVIFFIFDYSSESQTGPFDPKSY